MRKVSRTGNFFICLIFNMLMNFEWSIPAWILLVLHFIFDISIWWFVGALALWIIGILLWMSVIGWARSCATEISPDKENKNPYSADSFPMKRK